MVLKRGMNLALLTSTLEGGGAARVLVNMAEYWARKGHEVTLFSFESGDSKPFYEVGSNVRVVYLDLMRQSTSLFNSLRNNLGRLIKIRRAISASGADVVISFIDTANIRTIFSMLGTGARVIVSERIHPRYERIGLLWNMLRFISYPLAACVVAQTKQAAGYFWGWPLRRLRVIPNPVKGFAPPEGDKGGDREKVLVAVGRLYPQKGYDILLGAFSRLSPACSEWTLKIAGDGPERGRLERMANELGLGDRVEFLGHVKDVAGLLSGAGAYVMSSSFEGFPNALCEAMANGLACVSTDCPSGPADLIIHGHNGLLVPNRDKNALAGALEQLMLDSGLRDRLEGNARMVLDRYSEEKVMGLWEDCINKAVDK